MEVPASWRRSPDRLVRRLSAAARRRDPRSEVKIVAMSSREGAPPVAKLVIQRHSTRGSSMEPLRAIVLGMRQAMERGARLRGAKLTFESQCKERFCDVSYSLAGSSRMAMKARLWRSAGRLTTVSCGCANEGCEHLASCSLSYPPNASK